MNSEKVGYLKSIKPGPHPDGRKVLQEGVELGKTIQSGTSRFIRESGYASFLQYRRQLTREGKLLWNILLGLGTLEDQIQAIKDIEAFSKRTGLQVNLIQPIPSGVTGLPKELMDKAPATTSFVMDDFADYQAQVEASGIEVSFMDWILSSPAAIETTIKSLKAGGPIVGVFSQIIWGFPGFDDDLARFTDMVKALGMMASKYDEERVVLTYTDDGLGGYCMDCVSYVGYSLLEHYICTKLCGARYMIAFGGLLSDNDIRHATALAMDKVMSTPEQPVIHYINGSTNLQWDHDIHGNYGVSVPEALFAILVERKYKIGMGFNPVSITEKIAVPTLEELMNIFSAQKRAEEKAPDWEKFMDFTKLEEMRDVMAEQGRIFFENALAGMKAAGVDIEDPLEMILMIRYMNPMKFESLFHPSTYNSDSNEVKPFYPTILGKQTQKMKEGIAAQLFEAGLKDSLRGKKVVVASGDCHTYGLLLVEGILNDMGAQTVNGGVDMDPINLLDLADEEGTPLLGISCHNGQALDYARQLRQLAGERKNKQYFMFMGGVLNSILPGDSAPVDVTDMVNELGVFASNDLQKLVAKLNAV